jgi:branched-chain amino acid transport system ATP-binding protein
VTAVLACSGLTARYGGSTALAEVTLDVAAGAMVGVVGANGAGKSTLVNALAGWSRGRPAVSGEVRLGGESLAGVSAHERARRGLILVPEGKGIFHELTVEENLALVRAPADPAGRHAYTRDEVLALFPRLGERRRHKGGALSGGERQMLALGRALLAAPRVLVLDEPSIGLAPRLVLDLLVTVRRLVDRGLPVLLVEQNVRAALEVVDRVFLLERGRVVGEGAAAAMKDDPRIVEAYLGALVQ